MKQTEVLRLLQGLIFGQHGFLATLKQTNYLFRTGVQLKNKTFHLLGSTCFMPAIFALESRM